MRPNVSWTPLKTEWNMPARILLLAFLLSAGVLRAEEFNCEVSVIAPQVSNADPRIWISLEKGIKEFYNTRRFSNFNYAPEERIDLNLLLTINEFNGTDFFRGTLQVIYARPAFNSDYNSPVIDLVDNSIEFRYLENTQIDFTPDRFQNNLSSIMGFYAYFILGVDGDTFSSLGGTPFYTLAQQVVNNAQNASEPGWKAFEDQKNRYWLLDNQLQAVFRPLRDCLYNYHRMGMDLMTEEPTAGRQSIASSIEKLKTVHQVKPASYNLQVFFNAKYNELVELFKPVPPAEKVKVFNTLQIIDPGHISQYQAMMKGS